MLEDWNERRKSSFRFDSLRLLSNKRKIFTKISRHLTKKIEHFRSWCLVLVIFRQYYFCFSEANERSFRCATSGRRKMPPFWEKRPRVWRICVFRQCLDFPKSWPDTDCWHQKWLVWIFSLCYGGTNSSLQLLWPCRLNLQQNVAKCDGHLIFMIRSIFENRLQYISGYSHPIFKYASNPESTLHEQQDDIIKLNFWGKN